MGKLVNSPYYKQKPVLHEPERQANEKAWKQAAD